MKKIYYILFTFIIFFMIYYVINKQNIEGMTISSGSVRGYIKHQIRQPIRKFRENFNNPTLDYYVNKLNQILR
jgi:hypothetical protein